MKIKYILFFSFHLFQLSKSSTLLPPIPPGQIEAEDPFFDLQTSNFYCLLYKFVLYFAKEHIILILYVFMLFLS